MAEDASVCDPETLAIGGYSSYVNIASGPLIGAPGFDVTLGLSSRVELSGFVGMLHAQDTESDIHGLDDTYVGAKFLLLPDGPHRPGRPATGRDVRP